MIVEGVWTLSEVARLFGQPQHRLIHLCEKGVVRADFEEARGRGSSRRFSRRNLLQLAVALKLRELMVPVAPIGEFLEPVLDDDQAKDCTIGRLADPFPKDKVDPRVWRHPDG